MKEITPENMMETALNIIDFLNEKACWFDVHIYVANRCLKSNKYMDDRDSWVEKKTLNNTIYYEKEDVDVRENLEYCNPETITMTFEGPLYSVINYEDYDFVFNMTKKFLDEYGLYFEQGHAWSMAAY